MSFNYHADTKSYDYTPKDNPKDRLQVEIGDAEDSSKFFPQVKIKRWDNECNLSYRLNDINIPGNVTVTDDGEKITWIKKQGQNEWKAIFYYIPEGEGGFEFEVVLPAKPPQNYLEFTLVDNDVDYFYQPPLTQEEIDQGSQRPENVVGSYAIYAKTPKTNWTGGKEYKCGKIGHIFRPKIIDSAGTEVWGDLHIENGILSVTIPQDFLDKSVYPIRHAAGLTFGFDSQGDTVKGGSWTSSGFTNNILGSQFSLATDGGVASISFYWYDNFGVTNWKGKGAIYNSGSSLQGTTNEKTATVSAFGSGWMQTDYGSTLNLSSGDYIIVGWMDSANGTTYYDSGSTNQGHYQAINYGDNSGTYPSSATFTHNDRKFSIYATYTASGGEAPSISSPLYKTGPRLVDN